MGRAKKKSNSDALVSDTASLPGVDARELPFETRELRAALARFIKQPFDLGDGQTPIRLGKIRWGAYAFFDYDNKPIYVGQTCATLADRIGRHLTNQRTDVVAQNILDPFEVHSVEVWPLPQFQHVEKGSPEEERKAAELHLNALEFQIYKRLRHEEFSFLNEKEPPCPPHGMEVVIPKSIVGSVVSDEVKRIRDHPDLRIARRALTLGKLAQKASERDVSPGLRLALVSQATRLLNLATQRSNAIQSLRKKGVIVGPDLTETTDVDRDG